MRAITVKPQWAYAICHLGKRVENRTRKPPEKLIGQRIAIHAGKSWAHRAFEWMHERGLAPESLAVVLPAGYIVGTAVLVGWVAKDDSYASSSARIEANRSPWLTGPVGHLLSDVRVLATPIHCRGQLGYWTLPADVERAVLAQGGA